MGEDCVLGAELLKKGIRNEVVKSSLRSLPFALGVDSGASQSVPYLQADELKVERWRERLGAGMKIGLSWTGQGDHPKGDLRSLPPGQLVAAIGPVAQELELPFIVCS
jgi:hypothetical protein